MKNLLLSILAGAFAGSVLVASIVWISGQAALWIHAVGGAVAGSVVVILWAKLRSGKNGISLMN